MRNWNNLSTSTSTKRKTFPAYLWGIETLMKKIYKDNVHVFPAYLWGIETKFWNMYRCRTRSSQPTYEELKLFRKILIQNGRICSQPTYEELKPLIVWQYEHMLPVPSLPMRNWNPKGTSLPLTLARVPSLPMRNWNIGIVTGTGRNTWVPSLPMRNWNSPEEAIFENVKRFPAYLWGIETIVHLLCK